jgi:hypothetical protein
MLCGSYRREIARTYTPSRIRSGSRKIRCSAYPGTSASDCGSRHLANPRPHVVKARGRGSIPSKAPSCLADIGRASCAKCAGQSARYTGRDISGQKVERVTVEGVRAWPEDLGPLRCGALCLALSPIAGADGWPLSKGPGSYDRVVR